MSSEKKSQKKPTPMGAPKGKPDAETLAFIQAIDAYKREHERPFPGWGEVLGVLKSLGYHLSEDTSSGERQSTPRKAG